MKNDILAYVDMRVYCSDLIYTRSQQDHFALQKLIEVMNYWTVSFLKPKSELADKNTITLGIGGLFTKSVSNGISQNEMLPCWLVQPLWNLNAFKCFLRNSSMTLCWHCYRISCDRRESIHHEYTSSTIFYYLSFINICQWYMLRSLLRSFNTKKKNIKKCQRK